jgi:hypothetical protein
MTPEMRDVVEGAYRSFSAYQPGEQIDCLPRKLQPEIEHALLSTPLRAVARELLTHYNEAACHYGLSDDRWWPYFLPRYFELIARYEWPSDTGPWGSLRCLWRGEYRDLLSADELAVIDRFAPALLFQFITEPVTHIDAETLEVQYHESSGYDALDILDMFEQAEFDIWTLLQTWQQTDAVAADLHLASSINSFYGYGEYERSRLPAFAAWLRTHHVRERIEQTAIRAADSVAIAMFARAAQHLAMLPAAPPMMGR